MVLEDVSLEFCFEFIARRRTRYLVLQYLVFHNRRSAVAGEWFAGMDPLGWHGADPKRLSRRDDLDCLEALFLSGKLRASDNLGYMA